MNRAAAATTTSSLVMPLFMIIFFVFPSGHADVTSQIPLQLEMMKKKEEEGWSEIK